MIALQDDDKLGVLDLFSGIGGFSLGLEKTGGFQTKAFCEIEPHQRRILAKHWPKVPCYNDVRTLTAARFSNDSLRVRVICGGFPCQDVSEANVHGAGLDGDRSGLWGEYRRIICEIRPEYVIVENVSNLLNRGMDRVLGDLAALGYDAEWHCIPASAIGAPHDRDRVWIIAYATSRNGRPLLKQGDLARAYRLFTDREKAASRSAVDAAPSWHRPWREVTDALGRVDDGLSDGFHGYNACANAVVPQIPELIGNAILATLAQSPTP